MSAMLAGRAEMIGRWCAEREMRGCPTVSQQQSLIAVLPAHVSTAAVTLSSGLPRSIYAWAW